MSVEGWKWWLFKLMKIKPYKMRRWIFGLLPQNQQDPQQCPAGTWPWQTFPAAEDSSYKSRLHPLKQKTKVEIQADQSQKDSDEHKMYNCRR